MAPPPPALPMMNGTLTNGVTTNNNENKPNVVTPSINAGLLKEISDGRKSYLLNFLQKA